MLRVFMIWNLLFFSKARIFLSGTSAVLLFQLAALSSAQASFLKISHSGSTFRSQTNSISAGYSPAPSNETLKYSPWEFNASEAQSLTGLGSTQVTTTSSEIGASFKSKYDMSVSVSLNYDTANNHGVTSTRPVIGLDKKWSFNGDPINSDDDTDDDEDIVFIPRFGLAVTSSKKNSIQKRNNLAPKDFTSEMQVLDFGFSLVPFGWLSIDLNSSRFTYNQSIETAYLTASSTLFTNSLGNSYGNLLESYNDKEESMRISFKFTDTTALDLLTSKSHSIVSQSWNTDYTVILSSTFSDSLGYTIGISRNINSDSTEPSYSGEGSLSYYF